MLRTFNSSHSCLPSFRLHTFIFIHTFFCTSIFPHTFFVHAFIFHARARVFLCVCVCVCVCVWQRLPMHTQALLRYLPLYTIYLPLSTPLSIPRYLPLYTRYFTLSLKTLCLPLYTIYLRLSHPLSMPASIYHILASLYPYTCLSLTVSQRAQITTHPPSAFSTMHPPLSSSAVPSPSHPHPPPHPPPQSHVTRHELGHAGDQFTVAHIINSGPPRNRLPSPPSPPHPPFNIGVMTTWPPGDGRRFVGEGGS